MRTCGSTESRCTQERMGGSENIDAISNEQ